VHSGGCLGDDAAVAIVDTLLAITHLVDADEE
jgi:hypothetical protein